jgi:hypothetical protein
MVVSCMHSLGRMPQIHLVWLDTLKNRMTMKTTIFDKRRLLPHGSRRYLTTIPTITLLCISMYSRLLVAEECVRRAQICALDYDEEVRSGQVTQVWVPELGLQLMGLNPDPANRDRRCDSLPRLSIARSHGNLE